MLFLNVSAGLGLISQLSPLGQNVVKQADPTITAAALAVAGGNIVAITAIFNGLGRLFWASISDAIGRKMVFMIMFITQALLYIYLPQVANVTLFTGIGCYLLACYGGGFATMPAFAADSFGPGYIGKVYGMMLTAWGCAGIVGPLVFAQIKGIALYVAAGLLLAGFALAMLYKTAHEKSIEANMKVFNFKRRTIMANISVTLDGKKVETESGKTILDVARRTGSFIPTLCYYQATNRVGAAAFVSSRLKARERLSRPVPCRSAPTW